MASLSSANTSSPFYDVFLSFRGEDTRNNFVSHLYKALSQKGIYTFEDDKKLERGKSVSSALKEAIKSSRFAVIVFSENYASSSWCLNELSEIVKCMETMGQEVLPIFYNVDPSHVRKQKGSFEKAFVEHEKGFKDDLEMVQRWREDLNKVGQISGWDSTGRDESLLVEELVNGILKKLEYSYPLDGTRLVGMGFRIRKVISLLCTAEQSIETESSFESDGVRIIGIWGMGGIGKTAIARATFDRIFRGFDARCFLANVREQSKKHGINYLQRQLICRLLKLQQHDMENVDIGIDYIQARLRHLSVLIVLDDVDNMEQLDSLVGGHNWFGKKSRILITTRNRDVLRRVADQIYEVKGLPDIESMELFCWHSFKQTHPTALHVKLSKKVVNYSKGNPLALKVLGSYLYKRSEKEWESAVEKLKHIPHNDIYNVLKISFDDLDRQQQDVFLDIACFFVGKGKDYIVKILDSCGFFTEINLSDLVDRCLIYIQFEEVQMHDLIQEMGQEVVRRASNHDLGKQSRLMNIEDVDFVLRTNTGTNRVQAIALESALMQSVLVNPDSFAKMHSIRLLIFDNIAFEGCPEGVSTLPTSLTYMHWRRYPYDHLPLHYHIDKLVMLSIPESRIKTLWKGTKCPIKLKVINVAFSPNLVAIPDLSQATNLEILNLNGCSSLLELHPSCFRLASLKSLILSGCKNLKKFPAISGQMCSPLELYLDGTAVEELPSSIDNLTGLVLLNLKGCSMLRHLPNSICSIKPLNTLILTGCSRLEKLPQSLEKFKLLETLEVGGTAVTEMPFSIPALEKVKILSLNGCKDLVPWSLKLPSSSCLHNLTSLDLGNCNLMDITGSVGHLSLLRFLDLSRNNFESLPESIKQLSSLEYLHLAQCRNLKLVPKLPSDIDLLDADSCTSLEKIPILFNEFHHSSHHGEFPHSPRQTFKLSNCPRLDQHFLENVPKFDAMVGRLLSEMSLSLPSHTYILFFPGSEIPEWFSNWSEGCSLTLDTSSSGLSYSFWALAMCVVATLPEVDTGSYNMGTLSWLELILSIGKCEVFATKIQNGRLKSEAIGSDHLILCYTSAFQISCLPHSKTTTFSFRLYANEIRMNVKKCGLSLMSSRKNGTAFQSGILKNTPMNPYPDPCSNRDALTGLNNDCAEICSPEAGEFLQLFGTRVKRPLDSCSYGEDGSSGSSSSYQNLRAKRIKDF